MAEIEAILNQMQITYRLSLLLVVVLVLLK
jgi:hypothetical protein